MLFAIGVFVKTLDTLLVGYFIQHQACLLIRVGNGMADSAFIFAAGMAPALGNYPVANEVLIQADDEIVLILIPAYYQGWFTKQKGSMCYVNGVLRKF